MLVLFLKSNGEIVHKAPLVICCIEHVKAAHHVLIAFVDQLC